MNPPGGSIGVISLKLTPRVPPSHPPTSYIINKHTNVPIPFYGEARGTPPVVPRTVRSLPSEYLMYLIPGTQIPTDFLCYLLAAHKGTSIHLCTPKLFFVWGACVCMFHAQMQAIHQH